MNFGHIWKSHVCSHNLDVQETNVSILSSTGSEIITLDAGLRMDGIPALDLWDLVTEVLHSSSNQPNKSKGNVRETCCMTHHQENTPRTKLRLRFSTMILNLCNLDYVSSKVKSAQFGAVLCIFEDNEAVIKMIIKGRSPTMRHISRTHRVALDWLVDRINLDPKIQIKYVDTKNQLADRMTKGNFTRDEWNYLLHLFNISIFSSASCLEAIAKRMQQGTGEQTNVAKSKPTLNLVSRSASSSCTAPSSSVKKTSVLLSFVGGAASHLLLQGGVAFLRLLGGAAVHIFECISFFPWFEVE